MTITLLTADDALSLDDHVQTHLNYVPDLGRPVTLRQLIHHTSGIRDWWELLRIAGWRPDDVITTDHVIGLMARQQELNFERDPYLLGAVILVTRPLDVSPAYRLSSLSMTQ